MSTNSCYEHNAIFNTLSPRWLLELQSSKYIPSDFHCMCVIELLLSSFPMNCGVRLAPILILSFFFFRRHPPSTPSISRSTVLSQIYQISFHTVHPSRSRSSSSPSSLHPERINFTVIHSLSFTSLRAFDVFIFQSIHTFMHDCVHNTLHVVFVELQGFLHAEEEGVIR